MAAKLTWKDINEIAFRLMEELPDVEPLSIRFTDLHKWVCALDDFEDDPLKSNEKILEAIQMAWHEEWMEEHG